MLTVTHADHTRREVNANRLSLCASLFLAILSLGVGTAIDSVTLLLSSSAYLVDVITSLLLHRVILTIAKGPDPRYHFGYGKLEPLVAAAAGFSILAFCVMSAKFAVQDIIHADEVMDYDIAVWLGLVSCATGAIMSVRLLGEARRLNSQIIRLHGIEWRMEAFLSLGLAAGFLGARLLANAGCTAMAARADPVLSLILAAVLCGPPVRIIRENLGDLLDGSPGSEIENKALELARAASLKHGFAGVEKVRIRRAGRKLFLEVRVQPKTDEISKAATLLASEIDSQASGQFGPTDTIISFSHQRQSKTSSLDSADL